MKKTFKTIGEPAPVTATKPVAKTPQAQVLENAYVRVDYTPKSAKSAMGGREPGMYGGDKTDQYNEPRFFTQNKRGLDAQWAAVNERFNEHTTFRDVINILRDHGAKVHDYCAMD